MTTAYDSWLQHDTAAERAHEGDDLMTAIEADVDTGRFATECADILGAVLDRIEFTEEEAFSLHAALRAVPSLWKKYREKAIDVALEERAHRSGAPS